MDRFMDDDAILLNTLGITAAKPEDVERQVVTEVEQSARNRHRRIIDETEDADEAVPPNAHNASSWKMRLSNQLKALDQEITAVAAGLDLLDRAENEELQETETTGTDVPKAQESGKDHTAATRGLVLQRTLATDRLKSLEEKREELRKQLVSTQDDESVSEMYSTTKGIRSEGHDAEYSEETPISLLEDYSFDTTLDAASQLVETERDRLIRTGVLTPFDRVEGFERKVEKFTALNRSNVRSSNEDDTNILMQNSIANVAASVSAVAKARPTTKLVDASQLPRLAPPTREFRRLTKNWKSTSSEKADKQSKRHEKRKRPVPETKWRRKHRYQSEEEYSADEGKQKTGVKGTREEKVEDLQDGSYYDTSEVSDEDHSFQDVCLEGGLKIPGSIYESLFDYQKTGLKWLWELHSQRAGGIIGDEMGLGKTVQVVAFLGALHYSGMYKPSIVVCPATLLRQWRRELRKWYPSFHVEILHDSATSSLSKVAKLKRRKKDSLEGTQVEVQNEEDDNEDIIEELPAKGVNRWDRLIERVTKGESGLLVTTYEQLRIVRDKLLSIQWGYAILDEGHRIRNPDAEITLVCKQLQTVHRIIMSGAPIQNKLTELWSLFDFVFPGKLGVLPVFQAQFAIPIAVGGYLNATPLQVSTAYKCAVVLRDLIMPYLLRRMKSDVYLLLPKKTEHVLFCSLTEEQRSAYRAFLGSSEVEQIYEGNRNSLYGIDILRKICNHPDLLERERNANHRDYGNAERSGKLKVVLQVLGLWEKQGHRALIFTQTQQMLDIIENHMVAKGFVYRRMDGSTPVKQRMALIDEFNEATHVFVFILTTKVGGLGTNLVGANRVIIFDPDWNPSTDTQARERAWRIGQTRDVVIYRLITRGTIEEKVYHRQIYKHFLTNKILKDPQQRRFFKARDIRDLFTLQDEKHEDKTETSAIFAEVAGQIDLDDKKGKLGIETKHQSNRVVKTKKVKFVGEVKEEKDSDKETEKGETAEEPEESSRILKSLFEANGIHSAFDHDAIESMNNSEKRMIDSEADKVAQRAMEALTESRLLRSSDNVALPTWTGRSGAAGAPAAVRRRFGATVNPHLVTTSSSSGNHVTPDLSTSMGFRAGFAAGSNAGRALSSKDVLARLRTGQTIAADVATSDWDTLANDAGTSSSRSGGEGSSIRPELLKQKIRSFIQQNSGCASSAYVVEHFKNLVSTHEVPLFRRVLKEIADLKKGQGQEARWVLKEEHQMH